MTDNQSLTEQLEAVRNHIRTIEHSNMCGTLRSPGCLCGKDKALNLLPGIIARVKEMESALVSAEQIRDWKNCKRMLETLCNMSGITPEMIAVAANDAIVSRDTIPPTQGGV